MDREIIEVRTGSDGKAFIAVNLNGAPGKATSEGMVLSGDPTTPTLDYNFNFHKFEANKIPKIWEQCRCVWLKMRWFPNLPFENSNTGASYSAFTFVKERDGIDWDPSSTFPADTQIYTEPNFKAFNWFRPFTVFQRTVPYGYLSKVPNYTVAGIETTTGANIHGQWHGVNTTMGSLNDANTCHIYGRVNEAPPSAKLGHFLISAKFALKGSYWES